MKILNEIRFLRKLTMKKSKVSKLLMDLKEITEKTTKGS